jgi:hypothetical protein
VIPRSRRGYAKAKTEPQFNELGIAGNYLRWRPLGRLRLVTHINFRMAVPLFHHLAVGEVKDELVDGGLVGVWKDRLVALREQPSQPIAPGVAVTGVAGRSWRPRGPARPPRGRGKASKPY